MELTLENNENFIRLLWDRIGIQVF